MRLFSWFVISLIHYHIVFAIPTNDVPHLSINSTEAINEIIVGLREYIADQEHLQNSISIKSLQVLKRADDETNDLNGASNGTLVTNLDDYRGALPSINSRSLTIYKRSDLPILDTILTALKDSNIAKVIIDFGLLNPTILDVVINTTIWILQHNLINLTDLITAVNKSGLVLDIINLTLTDPAVIPGVLNITSNVLKEEGFSLSSLLKKRDDNNSEEISYGKRITEKTILNKRESALLNELFAALRDSGLAISVVQHLLTSPELSQPSAYFLVQILNSGALSLVDLTTALIQSNSLMTLLQQILQSTPQILSQVVTLIANNVENGSIPQAIVNSLL